MALGRPISLTNNVASKIIRVLATNNQTVFTVNGGYRINQIGVFRNGVRLSNNSDFTALDGVTVTLVNAAQTNDEVLFEIQDDFRVADAIVSAASTQVIDGDLTITGNFYYEGSSTGILTTGGNGSNLTGIVTSITAGDNITVSGATGNVTITGAESTVGISSGGVLVGAAKTLNFIGTGNTFKQDGDTIDISISGGGGGGGLGTAINYSDDTPTPFSFTNAESVISENLTIDSENAGVTTSYVFSIIPNITIASGVAVTVGVGKTMVIDVLQIGDL